MRLMQIAAASVHTLAGMMYTSFHQDTNIKPPEPPGGHFWQFRGSDHFYVDFYHTNYRRFEDFPFGLLNVVGYWAEAELFGGVVLFERVESGSEVQLIPTCSRKSFANGCQIINAFLHPQNTDQAFQLSQNQLKYFADLGTAGDPVELARAETILPFVKEPNARTEPTFTMEGEAPLRIYKNEYDKPLVSYPPMLSNCVIRKGTEEGMKMEKTMKFVQDKYPALFQDRPSPQDAKSARDGASSSKDVSPSANKKGP